MGSNPRKKELLDILGKMNWMLVIGFAMCQTWCILCVAIPSPVTYESTSPDLRWLSALTAVILTLPAVIWSNRFNRWFGKRSLIAAVGLLATLGSLLGPVSVLWPAWHLALIHLAAILVGVGFSYLFLMWYRDFSCHHDMVGLAVSILVCTLFTYPLAMLLYDGLINLWASSVIACALPLVSAGILIADGSHDNADGKVAAVKRGSDADKARLRGLLRFCLCLLLVITIVETAHNLLIGGAALSFYSGAVNLGVLICKLLFFVPLIMPFLHKDAEWVSRVYRLAFILLLGVVLTLPYLARGNETAHGLLDIGSFVYEIVIMLVAYQMSVGSRLNPTLVFGSCRMVWGLGIIFGILISGFSKGQGADALGILSVVLGISIAVAFCFLFTDWDCVRILAELPGTSNRARFRSKCLNLAQQCGLSDRECDVMILVAKGRSAVRIGDDMGISLATTNTHIHHIYQKIGVHSRQELLDAIEREQE